MSVLDDIRAKLPGGVGDKLTDAEIVQTMSEVMGRSPAYIAMNVGLPGADYIPNDGVMADTLTDLAVGTSNLPAIPAVLGDFLSQPFREGDNAPLSEAWDGIARNTGLTNWQQRQQMTLSPERQQADREVDQAEGFLDTLSAAAQNPRSVLGSIAQSTPAILAGGIGGRLLAGGARASLGARAPQLAEQIAKTSPYLAEGAVIHGMTSDQMMEQGADPRTALNLGAVAGLTGAGMAMGVGKLAGKLGLEDSTAVLGGQRMADEAAASELSYLQRVLGAGAVEGTQELMQSPNEQFWTNMATDRPLTEGLGKSSALGLMTGLGTGLAIGGVTQIGQGQPKITPAGQPVNLTGQQTQPTPTPALSSPTPAGQATLSAPALSSPTPAGQATLSAPDPNVIHMGQTFTTPSRTAPAAPAATRTAQNATTPAAPVVQAATPEHEIYKWMPAELRPLAGNAKFPYKGIKDFDDKLAQFDAGALSSIIAEFDTGQSSKQKSAPVKIWLAQRRLFEIAPEVAAVQLANDPLWGPFMAQHAPQPAASQNDPQNAGSVVETTDEGAAAEDHYDPFAELKDDPQWGPILEQAAAEIAARRAGSITPVGPPIDLTSETQDVPTTPSQDPLEESVSQAPVEPPSVVEPPVATGSDPVVHGVPPRQTVGEDIAAQEAEIDPVVVPPADPEVAPVEDVVTPSSEDVEFVSEEDADLYQSFEDALAAIKTPPDAADAYIAVALRRTDTKESYAAKMGILPKSVTGRINRARNHIEKHRDDQRFRDSMLALTSKSRPGTTVDSNGSRDTMIAEETGYDTSIDLGEALSDDAGADSLAVISGGKAVPEGALRAAMIKEYNDLRNKLDINPTHRIKLKRRGRGYEVVGKELIPEGQYANHRDRRRYAEEMLATEQDMERRGKLERFIRLSNELDSAGIGYESSPPEQSKNGKAISKETDALLREIDSAVGKPEEDNMGITYDDARVDTDIELPLDEGFVRELETTQRGEPVRLYRGLKKGGVRRRFEDDTNYPGDFYTEDPEFAKKYAGKGGRVIKKDFAPRKVFDVEEIVNGPQDVRDDLLKKLVLFMRAYRPTLPGTIRTAAKTGLYSALVDGDPTFLYPRAEDAAFLMAQGYDSVRIRSELETEETGPLPKTWLILDRDGVTDNEFVENRWAFLLANEQANNTALADLETDLAHAERTWTRYVPAGMLWSEIPEDYQITFARFLENDPPSELIKNAAITAEREVREEKRRAGVLGRDATSGRDPAETQGPSVGDGAKRGESVPPSEDRRVDEPSSADTPVAEGAPARTEAPTEVAPAKQAKGAENYDELLVLNDVVAAKRHLKDLLTKGQYFAIFGPVPDSGVDNGTVALAYHLFDESKKTITQGGNKFAFTGRVVYARTADEAVKIDYEDEQPEASTIARHTEAKEWARAVLDAKDAVRIAEENEESRGGKVTGATVEQVQRWLNRPLRSLGKWVSVRIVPDVAALRAETRLNVGEHVRGMRRGSTIYLVANRLDARTAREVFAHEVVGHLGLETVLGNDGLNKILGHIDGILASGNKRLAQIAATVDQNYPGLDAVTRNKEILAHLVEQSPGFGLVQQVVARVRSWLAKHGIGDVKLAELHRAIADAARAVQRDDVKPVFVTTDPQFSQISASYNAASDFIKDHLGNAKLKGAIWAASTEDLADLAAGVSQDLGDRFKGVIDQMMKLAAKQKHRVSEATKIAQAFSQLTEEQQKAANKYLLDSTFEQKWGYEPAWDPSVTASDLDAAFEARFNALDPSVQDVVIAVNRNMAQSFADKVKILTQIAQAHGVKPPRLAKIKGPYAPVKRFGDHVVTAMSQQLIDAMDKANLEQEKLDKLREQVNNGQLAPSALKGQESIARQSRAVVEALRKNHDHYFMDFADGIHAARSLERELIASRKFVKTSAHVKGQWREDNALSFPELNKVRTLLEDKLRAAGDKGKQAATALSAAMVEIELGMVAQDHARQSERQRRKIGGLGMNNADAPRDMMKAFSAQAIADAHYLANLEHSADLNAAMLALTKEAEKGTSEQRHEATTYTNELWTRYHAGLNYVPTPVADKIVGFNAAWNLVLSPIYYVQSGFQNVMMTLPYIAKSFGYARSRKEFYAAYMSVSQMVSTANFDFKKEVFPFDVNLAARDQGERDLLQWLLDRGRLDIALGSELGDLANGGGNKVADYYSRTFKRLPGMLETINRVTTALTAYRLAKAGGATDQKAMDYADRVIRKSHGNYEAWNTPKVIDGRTYNAPGVGKVIFQYRKFQFIQGAYLVSLVNQMVNGKDVKGQDILDDDTKLAAWKAMGFVMAHTVALAGTMGLPAVTAGLFLYQMAMMFTPFGDDDEPYDKDAVLYRIRKGMANLGFSPDVADLILNGTPSIFGANMTDMIGWSNLLSWVPYVKVDTTDKDLFDKLVIGAMGPSGTMGRKLFDGTRLMFEGDYVRGLEKLAPNGVNNFATLYRTQAQGETYRNGDQALSAADFNAWDGMMTVLGLNPEKVNKRWQKQAVKTSYETKYDARTSSLKKRYAEAQKEGDGPALRRLRKEWIDLQTKKRKEGFSTSPLSALLRAPREQAKRERDTAGGVKYDNGTRTFVRNVDRVY